MTGQLGAGQKIGRGSGNQRGAEHHAHSQNQGVPDGLKVLAVRDDGPGLPQIEAAIDDDRLGKYHDQGTNDQTNQNHKQYP